MLQIDLTRFSPHDKSFDGTPDQIPGSMLIRFLWETGHFRNPLPQYADTHNVQEADLPNLTLTHPAVVLAVQSYQRLEGNLVHTSYEVHKRAPEPDGDVGPATRLLATFERCAVPDYGEESGEPALGTRHWKGCNINQGGHANFHSAICEINRANITPHWEQNLREILAGINRAEHEIGMHWFFRENGKDFITGKPVSGQANTEMQWVTSSSGWIGLATVPSGSLPCSHSPIFNRYLATWNPNSVHTLTVLALHELGLHNKGFSHTNGGIGNPSIIRNTPASWLNDPAAAMQKSGYGGVPFPADDVPPGPGPQPPESLEAQVRKLNMRMQVHEELMSWYGDRLKALESR